MPLDQSGPGSNGNERVRHIPRSSITGAYPSDALKCHTRTPIFFGGGVLLLCKEYSRCIPSPADRTVLDLNFGPFVHSPQS